MRHIYHFSFSLREYKIDLLKLFQLFSLLEQNIDIIKHYQLLVFSFHCHSYSTRDQLKWTESSLPC